MILKSAGLGLVLWFLVTAGFRLFGHHVFTTDAQQMQILFIAAPIVLAGLTAALLIWLGEHPTDRAEAAIGLAFPGMLLNAFVTHEFDVLLPNLNPILGQNFGALMLLGSATILLTGLFMTRLAPQDERL